MSCSLSFVRDMYKDSFSSEWTEYLASLFEPDQAVLLGYVMRKGNKADYLAAMKDQLSDSCVEKDHLPATDDEALLIVDATAFIHHNQDSGCNKFVDLRSRYLQKMPSARPAQCNCVNVVGGRYRIVSSENLKSEEISRRQKTQERSRMYDINDDLHIALWKPFIANLMNKAVAQNYLTDIWRNNHKAVPQIVKLILGGLCNEFYKVMLSSLCLYNY